MPVQHTNNYVTTHYITDGTILPVDVNSGDVGPWQFDETDWVTQQKTGDVLSITWDGALSQTGALTVFTLDTTNLTTAAFGFIGFSVLTPHATAAADLIGYQVAGRTGGHVQNGTWTGFYANGDNLDPAAAATLYGTYIKFDGVDVTNAPVMYGLYSVMPAAYGAIGAGSSAGHFAGDARTVDICTHTAALAVAGGMLLDELDLQPTANNVALHIYGNAMTSASAIDINWTGAGTGGVKTFGDIINIALDTSVLNGHSFLVHIADARALDNDGIIHDSFYSIVTGARSAGGANLTYTAGFHFAFPTTMNTGATVRGLYVDYSGTTHTSGTLTGIDLRMTEADVAGTTIAFNVNSDIADANNSKNILTATADITGALAIRANTATLISYTKSLTNAAVFASTHSGVDVTLTHVMNGAGGGAGTATTTGGFLSLILTGTAAAADFIGTVDFISLAAGTGMTQNDGTTVRGLIIDFNQTIGMAAATGILRGAEINFDGITVAATGAGEITGLLVDASTITFTGTPVLMYGMRIIQTVAAGAGTQYGLFVEMPAAYGAATESALHVTGNTNTFDVLAQNSGIKLTLLADASSAKAIDLDMQVSDVSNGMYAMYTLKKTSETAGTGTWTHSNPMLYLWQTISAVGGGTVTFTAPIIHSHVVASVSGGSENIGTVSLFDVLIETPSQVSNSAVTGYFFGSNHIMNHANAKLRGLRFDLSPVGTRAQEVTGVYSNVILNTNVNVDTTRAFYAEGEDGDTNGTVSVLYDGLITGVTVHRADLYGMRLQIAGTKDGGDASYGVHVDSNLTLNNAAETFFAFNADLSGMTLTNSAYVYGLQVLMPTVSDAGSSVCGLYMARPTGLCSGTEYGVCMTVPKADGVSDTGYGISITQSVTSNNVAAVTSSGRILSYTNTATSGGAGGAMTATIDGTAIYGLWYATATGAVGTNPAVISASQIYLRDILTSTATDTSTFTGVGMIRVSLEGLGTIANANIGNGAALMWATTDTLLTQTAGTFYGLGIDLNHVLAAGTEIVNGISVDCTGINEAASVGASFITGFKANLTGTAAGTASLYGAWYTFNGTKSGAVESAGVRVLSLLTLNNAGETFHGFYADMDGMTLTSHGTVSAFRAEMVQGSTNDAVVEGLQIVMTALTGKRSDLYGGQITLNGTFDGGADELVGLHVNGGATLNVGTAIARGIEIDLSGFTNTQSASLEGLKIIMPATAGGATPNGISIQMTSAGARTGITVNTDTANADNPSTIFSVSHDITGPLVARTNSSGLISYTKDLTNAANAVTCIDNGTDISLTRTITSVAASGAVCETTCCFLSGTLSGPQDTANVMGASNFIALSSSGAGLLQRAGSTVNGLLVTLAHTLSDGGANNCVGRGIYLNLSGLTNTSSGTLEGLRIAMPAIGTGASPVGINVIMNAATQTAFTTNGEIVAGNYPSDYYMPIDTIYAESAVGCTVQINYQATVAGTANRKGTVIRVTATGAATVTIYVQYTVPKDFKSWGNASGDLTADVGGYDAVGGPAHMATLAVSLFEETNAGAINTVTAAKNVDGGGAAYVWQTLSAIDGADVGIINSAGTGVGEKLLLVLTVTVAAVGDILDITVPNLKYQRVA